MHVCSTTQAPSAAIMKKQQRMAACLVTLAIFSLLLPLPTSVVAFISQSASITTTTLKLRKTARIKSYKHEHLSATIEPLHRMAILPLASATAVANGAGVWATDAVRTVQEDTAANHGAAAMVLSDAADAVLSAAGMDPSVKLGLAAFGGVGLAAAGFKTAVYWRMQYVVAALLTNRVPAISGGAEVLELSAKDTKTLYYMPAGGVRRVILSTVKDLDQQLVDGAAIQAKVPTALARDQKRGKIACPSGTMDCVVSIYGFSRAVGSPQEGGGTAPTLKRLALEVARVLKSGGTVLFVEKGEAKELVEVLRETLGTVEVNMVQNLVDPYCVAMATKTKEVEGEAEISLAGSKARVGVGEELGEGAANRRERRRQKKATQSRGGQ